MSNLKKIREDANLSLSEIGELCDRSKQHMWELEKQDANPTLKIAYAIANVLGKSVYDIWPDKTEVEVEKVIIRRVKK